MRTAIYQADHGGQQEGALLPAAVKLERLELDVGGKRNGESRLSSRPQCRAWCVSWRIAYCRESWCRGRRRHENSERLLRQI